MVNKWCPLMSIMGPGRQHCQRDQCQWWDGEDCVIKALSFLRQLREKS
jgi:hypothetical protein